jgi:hypothetical protein
VIGVVAAALATERRDGEAAEARAEFAAALAHYRACAEGPDRDASFCAARRDVLAPQEADGFAGWAALEVVRREYRALGPEEARRRVELALAAAPDGPAAGEMRGWLAVQGRGVVAATGVAPAVAAAVEEQAALRRAEERRRKIGIGGLIVAAAYVARAAVGSGKLRWRSATVALGALGVVPAAMAEGWEAGLGAGFLATGLVAAVAILLAGRTEPAVAAAGTLGAMTAAAWWNGWLASAGVG